MLTICAQRHLKGEHVTVRQLFLALCTASLLIPAGAGGTVAVDVVKPDIIVVMVDDLGAIDERVLTRLPNIKQLFLSGGLRFDAAYSETPLCCPGRAAFLTGQHTHNHRVRKNQATLLNPARTIATALHDDGYQTGMFGKYLNHADKLTDKSPPGWDRVAMLLSNSADPTSWAVDDELTAAGYHDRYTLEQSTSWLAAASPARPLFMWTNPRAPHFAPGENDRPWIPAIEQRYRSDSRCAGIARWKPPAYSYAKQPTGFPLDDICRSLLTVDEMVGALREAQARRARPAVWVLTSDNGMAYGWHGFPLKNVPEAGRLPFYMAGAGVVAGATPALVSNIDFGPTIAQLGGTTMPWADGDSFVPLLHGQPGGREWMLEDHPLGGYTGGPWRSPWWGIRTPDWHLLRIGENPGVLYDLNRDPWEQRPLNNQAKIRELETLYPW